MNVVSIIVPCRNEVRHIDAFLESLVQQYIPVDLRLEVIVADGMSDDGTREKLSDWCQRDDRVVLLDNPLQTTSAALNGAIAQASGDVIVRMDVHTTYAPDYVLRCVEVLHETGATCVGGPWRPHGESGVQRCIALAFSSRFGSGGAASRCVEYSGPADTVYLGAWWRADLLRMGGFDETLVRNQDDELCLRILKSGGRIWQSATIKSSYTPRNSYRALFRQFYQYGYWKVLVIQKHQLPAAARHVVPFGFVTTLSMLCVLSPFSPLAAGTLAMLVVLYGIAVTAASIRAAGRRDVARVAWALVVMQIGYGLGFGGGVLDFVVLRRGAGQAMLRLTR